jgi:hypothetical protein
LLSGLEDKVLRRRLMVIFSTCIITTIVSLVHAAYILTMGGVKVVIAAIVEVGTRFLSGGQLTMLTNAISRTACL